MQIELWKVFTSLGVPGLALGVFYMLFRKFEWQFPKVPKTWAGPIVVLFMMLVAGIIFHALTLWAPNGNKQSNVVEYKGIIVNSYDNEPLWKATVKYSSNGVEKTFFTDSFGNYKLIIDFEIFQNTGTLTAYANGYKEKDLHIDLQDYQHMLPKISLEKKIVSNHKNRSTEKSLVPNVSKALTIKTDIFSKAVSPKLWFQEAKHYRKSAIDKGTLNEDDIFALKRQYNSSNYRKQRGIGKGWTHQYASRISIEDSTLKTIHFWDKSGRKIVFKPANPIASLSESLRKKDKSLSIESTLKDAFLAEKISDETYFLSNINGLIYFGIRMDVAQLSFEQEFIKIKLSSNERYIFNRNGLLIEIDEKSEPKIHLRYDPIDQSKLARVATLHGDKFIDFTYNDKGTISEVYLHDGTTYKYKYDSTGSLLINVSNGDESIVVYKYDNLGKLMYVSHNDSDDTPLVIAYNDIGWRIKETKDKKYKEWKFLDADEYSEVITTYKGAFEPLTKTYVFDNEKNILSIKDNSNNIEYKLTECGCLPLEVKSKHEHKKYEYDEFGNLKKIVTNNDTTLITYHNVLNKISSFIVTDNKTKNVVTERAYEYTEDGNLKLARTGDGLSISLLYNIKGRITNMNISSTESENKALEFTYNNIGKPTQIKLIGVGEINVIYDKTGEIEKLDNKAGHLIALKVTQAFQSLLSVVKTTPVSIDTRFNEVSTGI